LGTQPTGCLVCYTTSGYFLSLLNLYNLVAGAALAPAFIAACLDATRQETTDGSRRLGRTRVLFAICGVLWGLLILAGDPLLAVSSLLLAAGAVSARGKLATPWRTAALRFTLALGCGTLLAAPMLIEFTRILPLSYRGYWKFSINAALSQSWDPRSIVEWFVPFFFGRPDFTFWGTRFYGGNPPLFYSFYPGLLSISLIALAGWPRKRAAWWSWIAILGGIFLATGAWNPVVRWLYHLPGASALRYPVKLWLLVAIGCSLLCAIGFERLLNDGRRQMLRILGLLALVYLIAWRALVWLPPSLTEALRGLDAQRLNIPTLARETSRWGALCLLSLLVLASFALTLGLLRKRPFGSGGWLLFIHLGTQAFFLNPLYDSDETSYYNKPPPHLSAIPKGSTVVHGGFRDLFGKVELSPLQVFPDARFFWLTRLQAAELYPFAGVKWQRRYELNHSPEGLDSFFSVSLSRAIQQVDDEARLRLLAASGVDRLILHRELDPSAQALTRLISKIPGTPHTVFVYQLTRVAEKIQFVSTVQRAPQMNSALELLTSVDFDPRTMVVLPGSDVAAPLEDAAGEMPKDTPPASRGRIEILTNDNERLEVEAFSETGGVLLTQRAYLDIYRATLNGQATEPVVANLHRLAVEVPPGRHRVEIWIDKRPSRIGWLGALVGLLGLLAGSRFVSRVPFTGGER